MKYISSYTNVWIDFVTIDKIEIPFLLPYTYIMSEDAVDEELLSPVGLGHRLETLGLVPVEITFEEFLQADAYGNIYKKLSVHDRTALAIAKCRNITLLTGDGALRKAAKKENVDVMGTLGIRDQLWLQHKISAKEYEVCLRDLLAHNGRIVRLPATEIHARLRHITK